MRKKEKTIRTRQRGSKWYYSFDAGEVDGKRKQVSRGGFATEQEAMEAGMEAYTSWRHGNISITSERISVKDYLAKWLEEVMRPQLKRSTYQSYSVCVKRIVQIIGNKMLQDLRPRDVDQMLRTLAGRGLAHGTLCITRTYLSSAMKYAVYPAELIQSNPCDAVSIPKGAPRNVVRRTVITREKLGEIIRRLPPGHKCRIPCLLCFHTGMRISEALGLEWDSISMESGEVEISQQMQSTLSGNSAPYFETPKTEHSRRSFYIDSELIAELRKWKAIQSGNRIRMGGAYQVIYEEPGTRNLFTLPRSELPDSKAVRHDLVCTDDQGLPLKYQAVHAVLSSFGINSHSFRHTHATELIEGGARPMDVAARLGHADASMVDKVYGHDTEEMKRETLRIMEGKIIRDK